jgi:SAM-dependent methyltransferase
MFGIANRLSRLPLARKAIGHFRMMDRDKLHDFWRQREPEGNAPELYIAPQAWERSQVLLDMISDLPKDARILEVGCNLGRNVVHLFRAGYHNIEAIEISPHAVRQLREHFPELVNVPIHLGAAEDILPTFADRSFDLVFTMAVMEHIHPASVGVFDDIARIAKRIVAIEPSSYHISTRQFPHDLPAMFSERGFKLESVEPLDHVPDLETYSAFQFWR